MYTGVSVFQKSPWLDETAESLTKNEQKEYKKCKKNKLNGCHLLFEEYLSYKTSPKKETFWNCAEEHKNVLTMKRRSLWGGKDVKNLEIFWMSDKTIFYHWILLSYIWYGELCRSLRMLSTDNTTPLDLNDSSYYTHSIQFSC